MRHQNVWVLLLVVVVVCCCVLSFYQPSDAAPRRGAQQPFANAVEQRLEMINQLREIKELLKEQNALLRSGKLTVVATAPGQGN